MAEVIEARVFQGRRLAVRAAIVAVLGFIGLAIGLAVDPARAWLSYLMAFVFAFTLVIGGLIFLMSGYAMNGKWVAVVRRATEAVTLPLPALVVLFVPIIFGVSQLYPWAPGATPPAGLSHHDLEIMQHRAGYLNVPFFAIRAAIYFAVFLIASRLLRSWSVRRDAQRDAVPPPFDDAATEASLGRDRTLSSAMLPPVALAMTFAGFDWIMSLEPTWYSSIFGFYLFGGGFLTAIAAVTVLAARIYQREPAGVITPNHFHALGRLMLAFIVFWTYIGFFQAMLIRIANKPNEVTYFLERTSGAWGVLVYVLIIGHFALPFLILLPRQLKFRPRAMAAVAAWLVVMHLVDVYWMIIPAHVQGDMVFSWLDLAALAAVIGTSVAVAAWRQDGISIIAEGDPFLGKGAAYRSTQL